MNCVSLAAAGRVTLSHPAADRINGQLRDSLAACLAAAFASGPWAHVAMPIGETSDPCSARGIIAQLGSRAQVLVATGTAANGAGPEVLGCVLGGVLDDRLLHAYRLADYGARGGDALLAYIGVAPAAQGSKVSPLGGRNGDTEFALWPRQAPAGGVSLASLLFERWLERPAITCSPRVFIRTRKILRPILHLAEKNGFRLRGRFEMEFRGERQDRLVFARHNAPSARAAGARG